MTEATYLVLLHGDELEWEARDAAAIERVTDSHRTFSAACANGGHEILSGEELDAARTARVVRRGPGRPAEITDGPFAEYAEQIGGFYLVRTDDRDALVELVVSILTEDAEIRPIIDHSAD